MTQGDDVAGDPSGGAGAAGATSADATGSDAPSATDNPASDPSSGPATPGATPDPATPSVGSDALAGVCARASECDGTPMDQCLAQVQGAFQPLLLLCPDLAGPYIQCLSESPTCAPDVDCAAEAQALENCGAGSVTDDATVQTACDVYTACEGGDASSCVADYQSIGSAFEVLCPGAFGPYLECIAMMTGCDVQTECADEVAAIEACGLTFNGMDPMMP